MTAAPLAALPAPGCAVCRTTARLTRFGPESGDVLCGTHLLGALTVLGLPTPLGPAGRCHRHPRRPAAWLWPVRPAYATGDEVVAACLPCVRAGAEHHLELRETLRQAIAEDRDDEELAMPQAIRATA